MMKGTSQRGTNANSIAKCYCKLPSLLTNSDFELADNERNRAAEFGRYVSNEADNSINGLRVPCVRACVIWNEVRKYG